MSPEDTAVLGPGAHPGIFRERGDSDKVSGQQMTKFTTLVKQHVGFS